SRPRFRATASMKYGTGDDTGQKRSTSPIAFSSEQHCLVGWDQVMLTRMTPPTTLIRAGLVSAASCRQMLRSTSSAAFPEVISASTFSRHREWVRSSPASSVFRYLLIACGARTVAYGPAPNRAFGNHPTLSLRKREQIELISVITPALMNSALW